VTYAEKSPHTPWEPEDEPVLVERSGAVLTITLNRPRRRNAIDRTGWQRLLDVLTATAHDESVRAVVVTGAGGDFCAGADLAADGPVEHPLTRMRLVSSVADALHRLPQPVVARVEGVAVGAGLNLALGCDLVVASTTARFSEIFARRGLSLDFGGSWLLPRIVGMQQAKRLAFLGDIVDAEEALDLGLVTWVKEPHQLDAFVAELTEQLAKAAPVALAQSKALLHEAASRTFHEALESEARAQVVNFATDAPSAKQAFLDKVEPTFTGQWQL
jgi:enoyl-CoA hydratase/carnithine racemase